MIRLLRQIISEPWAIMPEYAAALGPILRNFLENKDNFKTEYNDKINSGNDNIIQKDIAFINIQGELTKYSTESGRIGMLDIAKSINELNKNDKINGLILIIDSPGGTVSGTEELANEIKNFKKPVFAYINGMAASAAYWIASAADKIYAHLNSDIVGSIGVMFEYMDLQPYYEKQGVVFHKVYASQSKDKNLDFEEMLKGNYEPLLNSRLNVLAKNFISTVKINRSNVQETQLTGKTFFASDVVGTMIDGISTLDQIIENITNQINSQNSNQITMTEKTGKSFWDVIGSALGLKTDGTNLEPEDVAFSMNEKIKELQKNVEQLSTEKVNNANTISQKQAKIDELTTQLDELKQKDGAAPATVVTTTNATTINQEGPVVNQEMTIEEKMAAVQKKYFKS